MASRNAAPRRERPLVVASNRLPFTVHRGSRGLECRASTGGLVSALEPALGRRGGTWIGWPGLALREGERLPPEQLPFRVAPVRLSEKEISRYYHGFSNRTLWPLLHSLPVHARFDRGDFETYDRVNRRFAELAVREVSSGDLIWVHDYQLMLTPGYVRQAMPEARLAFFLHIPFPPYDIFRLLPWDRQLLRGLLACDLVGFHVEGYARNFMDCVERRLGARVDFQNGVVEHGDRTVRVSALPIGIDFHDFEAQAQTAAHQPLAGNQVVLGVDRLDYTKGIPERIAAFQRLLELYPEHRERVVLLQVAVPSRSQVAEYRNLKREIDELVGQVNGRFATASWSPIQYLYRSLGQERLVGMYRDADVAMVTPLRDGMNLVAKEFVACQVDDPGVLVLSSLAGAAETMREALQVNPYDVDATARTLHRALCMDETERRSRIAALRRREERADVHTWVNAFLARAAESRVALAPVGAQDFDAWLGAYLTRPRLAVFLDYDGTLSELRDHPSQATLDAPARDALAACAARSDCDVAIVTGRALTEIQKVVGEPALTYAGNHGLEIAGPGIPEFRHEDLVHYETRTAEIVRALQPLARDGAWVEPKGPTLSFHFRALAPRLRTERAARAREIITAAGFQARDAHLALEGRPPIGWDKGHAVLHILRARYGLAWSAQVRVIYVGDDQTDEDAFRFLSGLAATFRVGPADSLTSAARRLPNVIAVRALLEWLAGRGPR